MCDLQCKLTHPPVHSHSASSSYEINTEGDAFHCAFKDMAVRDWRDIKRRCHRMLLPTERHLTLPAMCPVPG